MSNMISNGVLDILDLNTGNTIKFGDKTPLKYQLIDSNNDDLDIVGLSAEVIIIDDELQEKATIASSVVEENNIISFSMDNNYKPGFYFLEIVVDGKYIFPSEHKSGFRITKSSLSIESEMVDMDNIDDLMEKIKNQINLPENTGVSQSDLLDSETKILEQSKEYVDGQVNEVKSLIEENSSPSHNHEMQDINGLQLVISELQNKLQELTSKQSDGSNIVWNPRKMPMSYVVDMETDDSAYIAWFDNGCGLKFSRTIAKDNWAFGIGSGHNLSNSITQNYIPNLVIKTSQGLITVNEWKKSKDMAYRWEYAVVINPVQNSSLYDFSNSSYNSETEESWLIPRQQYVIKTMFELGVWGEKTILQLGVTKL